MKVRFLTKSVLLGAMMVAATAGTASAAPHTSRPAIVIDGSDTIIFDGSETVVMDGVDTVIFDGSETVVIDGSSSVRPKPRSGK